MNTNPTRRIRLVVLAFAACAAFAACGPSSKPATRTTPASVADAPAQPEANATPEVDAVTRACTALIKMTEDPSCEFVEELRGQTVEQCIADNRKDYDGSTGSDRELLDSLLTCIGGADKCGDIQACVVEAVAKGEASGEGGEDGGEAPAQGKKCGELGFGPVVLDADEASARHGQTASKFSSHLSSKDKPIEVCGVQGQLEWLTRVTCDDGSNPFSTPQEAHAARSGNVGPGGRCASVIDRYEVTCPERTYAIYIDAYMCGPGEAF